MFMAHDQAQLIVLGILGGGRMPYADVRAEYERRVGIGGEQTAVAFAQLVQNLIAEKLIDYEADPSTRQSLPRIAVLWLRPRGKAKLAEGEPPAQV